MATDNLPVNIKNLLIKITGQEIEKNQKIEIEDFKKICKNYLQTLDAILNKMQQKETLEERIFIIGQLMHEDTNSLQELLIASHIFENALNTFLGRSIPITWVSRLGQIFIASEEDMLKLYNTAEINDKSGAVGLFKGINKQYFQQKMLNPKLKQLQEQLNRSAENKKEVFLQSKRRYQKTTTKDAADLAYENQPEGKLSTPNIYWRVTRRGDKMHWSKRIPNAGYVTQGYVAMVLKSRRKQLNEKITFPDPSSVPDPNLYILKNEQWIKRLSYYAAKGDNLPGIILGDVKASTNGDIQLAVKSGPKFRSASISGNVAIAYAFLYIQQDQLLKPQVFRRRLENIAQKYSQASWKKIFSQLAKVPQKEISNIKLTYNILT